MAAEVRERTGRIRGVDVRWIDVVVAGHTVEQVLSYDVEEAESAHGRPFDDEMDRFIQMGMFAMDRIAADGTMGRVASATSYVLDGRCIRTAKIMHCSEIEPMSAGWTITRADGTEVKRQSRGCVPGMPPTLHKDLPPEDDVTRFLRGVSEKVKGHLQDDDLRPDRDTRAAVLLGYGYRVYRLWYSRSPWDVWDMSYRMTLKKGDERESNGEGSPWSALVGFTYLKDKNVGLETKLNDTYIHEKLVTRTDEVEDEEGRLLESYGVWEVSLTTDDLSESFAETMANAMARLISAITPVVNSSEGESR